MSGYRAAVYIIVYVFLIRISNLFTTGTQTDHSNANYSSTRSNRNASDRETETVLKSNSNNNGDKAHVCSDDYEKRPDADNVCSFLGIPCKYGYCDRTVDQDGTCRCDEGATGLFCEDKCCLDCGEHGVCLLNGNNELCNCYPGYTGPRCAPGGTTKPGPHTKRPDNADGIENDTTTVDSDDTSNVTKRHACAADYQMRPEAERACGLYPCKYGYCELDDGYQVCHCDDGATGLVCEDQCCKDCGQFGSCLIETQNNTEMCNCWANYTGPACENFLKDPEPSTPNQNNSSWFIWLVIGCIAVLVLVLMVTIPYIMWKHRVIPVMKVVHYFQEYEDDDEKEWDAFISYKSSPRDEGFVTRVLFPKLEQELGFKLNVHYRDFIPGDTIANNIIRAINSSRRTILIITPDYVNGEYTKFEYQVAQQQMLKKKHKIIPILLDNISDCEKNIDPNLKFILRTVTYLEWPHDVSEKRLGKFWKRLQLSLPKKRKKNNRNKILEGHPRLDTNAPKETKEANGLPKPNPLEIPITFRIEDEQNEYDTIQEVEHL